MAYTVLARKYRPKTFDDVIGQDPIARTLKNAIKTDRIAHAYLFTGTRGVGKTTMARILAKALNCLSFKQATAEPCCTCESCKSINIGEDIDVIEIDGASNNRVDEVRTLRENAIYRPARSRYKVYIIDEVHMLTTGAFNALLKTLEEPPGHVKFIFATTEPNKVIPTIQSRCQRFDFRNIGTEQIAGQLKHILEKEGIEYEEELVLPLAKMANGSMRDGLSLLDRLISTGVEKLTADLLEQYLGCPEKEKIYALIERIGESDAAGTLQGAQELINSGLSEVQIIDSLIDSMRDLMVLKTTEGDSALVVLTSEQKKRVKELAEKFDMAAIVYAITSLEKMRWSVKNSDIPKALLESLLVRFALSEHFMNVDELLSRIEKGGLSGQLKKKPIKKNKSGPKDTIQPSKPEKQSPSISPGNLEELKEDWHKLLNLIASHLGQGTAGLLSSAKPMKFSDGKLTLAFNSRMQKKMFESNGRSEQVLKLLCEYCESLEKLEFEAPDEESIPPGARRNGADGSGSKSTEYAGKIDSKTRNELINDPVVKTVLLGLDAKITKIEEGKEG